jgi:hypothetical protein
MKARGTVLLLVAGLFVAGWWVWHGSLESTPSSQEPPAVAPPAAGNSPVVIPSTEQALKQPTSPVQSPPTAVVAATDPAEIENRKALLLDYAWETDPKFLRLILADLNHPGPEVRATAREAAKHFGSRDAIPALEAQLAATEDLKEKVALQEAVEFLQLPTMTEYLQQRAAKGLTNRPKAKRPPPAPSK